MCRRASVTPYHKRTLVGHLNASGSADHWAWLLHFGAQRKRLLMTWPRWVYAWTAWAIQDLRHSLVMSVDKSGALPMSDRGPIHESDLSTSSQAVVNIVRARTWRPQVETSTLLGRPVENLGFAHSDTCLAFSRPPNPRTVKTLVKFCKGSHKLFILFASYLVHLQTNHTLWVNHHLSWKISPWWQRTGPRTYT